MFALFQQLNLQPFHSRSFSFHGAMGGGQVEGWARGGGQAEGWLGEGGRQRGRLGEGGRQRGGLRGFQ